MAYQRREEKWVKHYSSSHRILLVGEGDFSFSLCLARSFGSALNICASSFDKYDELVKKYKKARSNLEILKNLGALVLHGVDATQMDHNPSLQNRTFDRIVFNFPHAGFFGKEDNPDMIKIHQILVFGFFWCAKRMLSFNGEIHVSHKDASPYRDWNLVELADDCPLELIGRVEFQKQDFVGYENKRGSGSHPDGSFHLGKCSTWKFKLPLRAKSGLAEIAWDLLIQRPGSHDFGYPFRTFMQFQRLEDLSVQATHRNILEHSLYRNYMQRHHDHTIAKENQNNHMQFKDDSYQLNRRPVSHASIFPDGDSIPFERNRIPVTKQTNNLPYQGFPVYHRQEPVYDPGYIQKRSHVITVANRTTPQFQSTPREPVFHLSLPQKHSQNEYFPSDNISSYVSTDISRSHPMSYHLHSPRHDPERYNEPPGDEGPQNGYVSEAYPDTAQQKVSLFDIILRNVSESFNASLNAGSQLVISLFKSIIKMPMARMTAREAQTEQCIELITPKAREVLAINREIAVDCRVLAGNLGIYGMETGGKSRRVDIRTPSCACKAWDISGIPCSHAIVHEYHSTIYWRKAYKASLEPVNGEDLWVKRAGLDPMLSPQDKVMPCRLKKNRRNDPYESPKKPGCVSQQGRIICCNHCWKTGHNKKTCSMCDRPLLPTPQVELKPRGKPKAGPVEEQVPHVTFADFEANHPPQNTANSQLAGLSVRKRGRGRPRKSAPSVSQGGLSKAGPSGPQDNSAQIQQPLCTQGRRRVHRSGRIGPAEEQVPRVTSVDFEATHPPKNAAPSNSQQAGSSIQKRGRRRPRKNAPSASQGDPSKAGPSSPHDNSAQIQQPLRTQGRRSLQWRRRAGPAEEQVPHVTCVDLEATHPPKNAAPSNSQQAGSSIQKCGGRRPRKNAPSASQGDPSNASPSSASQGRRRVQRSGRAGPAEEQVPHVTSADFVATHPPQNVNPSNSQQTSSSIQKRGRGKTRKDAPSAFAGWSIRPT